VLATEIIWCFPFFFADGWLLNKKPSQYISPANHVVIQNCWMSSLFRRYFQAIFAPEVTLDKRDFQLTASPTIHSRLFMCQDADYSLVSFKTSR
jgi:hypothetical protein